MRTFLHTLKVIIILVIALFIFTYMNCLFWATVNANSQDPPPNKPQWEEGWKQTKEIWTEHYLFFLKTKDD